MSFPRYERYKDSGVEWLGEVPVGWEVKSIKQIVATPITDGPHETPVFLEDGIPFVSAEAVSSGKIDFTKIRGFISESVHKGYSQKYCPQFGDIYMVKSGATTGITAIVDTEIEFNIWSPLAAIRCGEKAVPLFVLNFMRSKNFQEAVTLNWSFGTQQNIGMGVIENLSILLPPLPEQQTIAAFLDRETGKIDALVAEQERLIALLKEKRQAVISHAVTKGLNPDAPMKDSGIEWLGEVPEGWDVKALKHGYTVKLGKMLQPESKSPEDELFPYLRASNLQWSGVDLSDVKSMWFSPAERAQLSLLKDDLLVSEGGDVGRSAIWNGEISDCYFQNAINRVRANNGNSIKFLYYWMSVIKDKGYVDVLCNKSTIAHFTAEKVQILPVPFPPIPEQQTIVAFLDSETVKIDTLISEAQQVIVLLKERRSALISAAVTGKIDVRQYAKEATA